MSLTEIFTAIFYKFCPERFVLIPLLLGLQTVGTAVYKRRHGRENVDRVTNDDNHLLCFVFSLPERPRVMSLRYPDQVVIADNLLSDQAHHLAMYGDVNWHVGACMDACHCLQ